MAMNIKTAERRFELFAQKQNWVSNPLPLIRRSVLGFVRRHIVDDVPPEMDLCVDCRKLQCFEATFKDCAPRKARADHLISAKIKTTSRTTLEQLSE
jgi:hypothetical protein